MSLAGETTCDLTSGAKKCKDRISTSLLRTSDAVITPAEFLKQQLSYFFQNSDKQSTISVRRAASGLAEDCEAKDLCLPQYSLNFLIYMCKVFKIRKFKDGPRRHAATCQELTTKISIKISRLVFV